MSVACPNMMVVLVKAVSHFSSLLRNTWYMISCYGKAQNVMSPSSDWACDVGFTLFSILIRIAQCMRGFNLSWNSFFPSSAACNRSRHKRRRIHWQSPEGVPMVPWDAVSSWCCSACLATGSVGSWGVPRAQEWNAHWGVCSDLQLSGKGKGQWTK